MESFFPPDPLVRLPFYISLGLLTEVLFTGICDMVYPAFLASWRHKGVTDSIHSRANRDPRAMGYTFLVMIPAYGCFIFIEPLSILLQSLALWQRGFVYLGIFWLGEYLYGALLKKITGVCPWDYSNSSFSLHGYIRWDFAPFWYGFTVFLDGYFTQHLVELTPAIKATLDL